MIVYFPRAVLIFKCDFVKISIKYIARKTLKLMRKFSQCLDFCWPKLYMFRIFVDYGLDFWWQNKIRKKYYSTIITHLSHFHILDVMEFNTTDGWIYSFILWVRMSPWRWRLNPFMTVLTIFDLKTKGHHLKPDGVNYVNTSISTPVKVTRLPNGLW